jgi:hypothetical protein
VQAIHGMESLACAHPCAQGYGAVMAEDWRVTIAMDPGDEGLVSRALEAVREHDVEHEARKRLGGRVAVSRDDDLIFLYADAEPAAREAAGLVSTLLAEHGLALEGEIAVERWHPVEERWEDPSVALPSTDTERRAEVERRDADEDAEARASGEATWEVRIEFEEHDDATAFPDRLDQEGHTVVRRWTFLLVGAEDEDAARELAERLRQEAPSGAQVEVEPGAGPVWDVYGNNPFAFFGGLAG